MNFTVWPSPAKINLFLYIQKKRKDGYHELKTLFQFINYGDIIYIKIDNSGTFYVPSIRNIFYKKNVVFKSLNLLIQESLKYIKLPKNLGIKIFIKKLLPFGSGLGGGSSNAATVMLALNKLLNLNLSIKKLITIGLKIGADVPFFLSGHSAFAEGIGDKIKFINLKKKWYLIVYPKILISTKKVFQNFYLPNKMIKINKNNVLKKFHNDLEYFVRKNFYKFEKYFLFLQKYAPFSMTGSGSCMFSEFDSFNKAKNILDKLPKYMHAFIAKGENISPLYKLL